MSTWNDSHCSWETLLERHSSQASLLQAQPSCLHPCGPVASMHAVLPNQPNGQKNVMGYYFDETMVLPTDNLPNAIRSKAEGLTSP
jgi:hypothetical protein